MEDRKIGVLGGMGPQATSILYNGIIKYSQSKYNAENNSDFPKITIESVPVPDFISNQENIAEAKAMLVEATNNLEKVGATKLCIGCNTVHLLLPELEKHTSVKFLSMIDLVVEKLIDMKVEKVGILASTVTLNKEVYSQRIEQEGMKVIIPNENQKDIIDKIIRYVLAGRDNGKERNAYIKIINDLFNRGAEIIVLGCTELPKAINYEALGSRVVNSIEALAEGLVDYYYS